MRMMELCGTPDNDLTTWQLNWGLMMKMIPAILIALALLMSSLPSAMADGETNAEMTCLDAMTNKISEIQIGSGTRKHWSLGDTNVEPIIARIVIDDTNKIHEIKEAIFSLQDWQFRS